MILSGDTVVTIGMNAKDNDKLTFEDSCENTLWFHTDEYSGSHVTLYNPKGEYSQEDIKKTAEIAAYYSKGRNEKNVIVMYTPIEKVSKNSKCSPGEVIVDEYKTINVRRISFRG